MVRRVVMTQVEKKKQMCCGSVRKQQSTAEEADELGMERIFFWLIFNKPSPKNCRQTFLGDSFPVFGCLSLKKNRDPAG